MQSVAVILHPAVLQTCASNVADDCPTGAGRLQAPDEPEGQLLCAEAEEIPAD